MDVHTPETRSYNMSRIKGKNTKPEQKIRQWLWHNGYRYRLHYKNLPGKPDIVFPGNKKVIFIHGCFWHRHQNCKYCTTPKSNVAFWEEKLSQNITRDKENYKKLTDMGWSYQIIWECEIKKSFENVESKIINFLDE